MENETLEWFEVHPVHVFIGEDMRCMFCDRRMAGIKTPPYCEGE